MRQIHLTLLLLLVALTSQAQQRQLLATVTVSNPTTEQRHEVVSIDTTGMRLPADFIVQDAFGIERPWQLTHDGLLLIDVRVRPTGQARYTVSSGRHKPMKAYVGGRYYPERADDISFENDRTGFRIYGPTTQRRGEQAFGHDVWVKATPELMLDSLYSFEFSLHKQIYALRDRGGTDDRLLADSLEVLTSYHLDHGFGMDCYNVGPTLACGTPTLMDGDTMLMPWCYETFEILDNGPLRFTLRLDFGRMHGATEHRLLVLDKGSNFCRCTVWYDGMEQPRRLAAGVAIRQSAPNGVVTGPDYVQYADPTGDVQRHNCQIYVATVFPNGVDETRFMPFPAPVKGNVGHAVGIVNNYTGKPYTYYFGAAWSEYDVRSQAEWQLRIDALRHALRQPLTVTID